MPGTIEVVIGPMRSNKTAELIRRVAMREEYAHQSVILFKPKDDTKSAQGVVRKPQPAQPSADGCGGVRFLQSVGDVRLHR